MVSYGIKLKPQLGILVKKTSCFIERRRALFKNYLTDRSYENKRNVMKFVVLVAIEITQVLMQKKVRSKAKRDF